MRRLNRSVSRWVSQETHPEKEYTRKDYRNHQVARWAVRGVRQSLTDDFVWSCVTSPWWLLVLLVVTSYLLLAMGFAMLLALAEHLTNTSALEGDLTEGWSRAEGHFWLALLQLLSTGLGEMRPANRVGYAIVATMHLVGMVLSALLLGFFVTQANTPQARILFSKVGVMRYVDGKQQLVLRGGNVRGVFLSMPEIRLSYVHEVSIQGCLQFVECDLPLQRQCALHPGFEIVYTVTPGSAIAGKTKDDMVAEKGFFAVVISGTDEYTCQEVKSQEAVLSANVYWCASFESFRDAPIRTRDRFGIMRTLNFSRLESVVILPPEHWPAHLPPLPEDQYERVLKATPGKSETGYAFGFAGKEGSHRLTYGTQAHLWVREAVLRGVGACQLQGAGGPSAGSRLQSIKETLRSSSLSQVPKLAASSRSNSQTAKSNAEVAIASRKGSLEEYSPLTVRNWSIEAAGYGAREGLEVPLPEVPWTLDGDSILGHQANPKRTDGSIPVMDARFPSHPSAQTASCNGAGLTSGPGVSFGPASPFADGPGSSLKDLPDFSKATRELLRKSAAAKLNHSGDSWKKGGPPLLNQNALVSYKSEPLDNEEQRGALPPALNAIDLSRIGIVHARSSRSLAREGLLQGADAVKAETLLRRRVARSSDNVQSSLHDRLGQILKLQFR